MSNNLVKMRETFDPESIDSAAPFDHDGLVDCYAVCVEMVWLIEKARKVDPADLQNIYMRAKAAVGNAADTAPLVVTAPEGAV